MQEPTLPRHIQNPDPTIYQWGKAFTLDWETTNIDYGSALSPRNQLILGCYAAAGEAKIISSWGNELCHSRLIDSLEQHDFLIGHNLKFELQWLRRMGLDLSKVVVWDTMIAQYVIAGNRKFDLSLEGVADYWKLGHKDSAVSALIKGGVCPSEIPKEWLEKYCIQDVRLTNEIFKQQLLFCTEHNLLPAVYTRCLLTPVLADIEFNGMALDKEVVEKYFNECAYALSDAKHKLNKFANNINWNSNDQLADFLYNQLKFDMAKDYRGNPMLTSREKPSVSAEALSRLKPRNKKQKEFLALYKEVSKLEDKMSKYLSKFLECTKEGDGILYANFNQCVTRSHRLSSSGKEYKIQFQNYDRSLKNVVKPRHEGWSIAEADGASLEFRVAAHLGRDSRAINDIDNKIDVHTVTAAVLNNVPEDEVTKEQRQNAKRCTFKPLYGGSSGTEDEQRYYKHFKEKYPGITKTQNRWIMSTLDSKQLVTETGLIFYWPNTMVKRSGYIVNRESICNYPVQSLATADIIPIALVYQWHFMKALGMESFLVSTVHDSTIGEICPGEEELFKDIAVESYTNKVYFYLNEVYKIQFQATLGVGYKIGSHWSVGEETKIDVKSPYRSVK